MVRTTMVLAAVLAAVGWTVAGAATRPAKTYEQCRKQAVGTADIAECQRTEIARLNPRCVIDDTRSRLHELQAFGKPFA